MNEPTKTAFSALLKQVKLDKTELALRLGLNRGTVYQWREEAPAYAVAYLQVYRKVLALQEDVSTLRGALQRIKDVI